MSVAGGPSGFHLHKDNGFVVFCDNIDFTESGAVIFFNNPISVFFQIADGIVFAFFAILLRWCLHAGSDKFFYPFEGLPVDVAAAERRDGFFMGFGRIAFVFVETEMREFLVVLFHQTIAGDFGNN
mgnify:CR=1 FL=1